MTFSNLPNNPPQQSLAITTSYTQVGAGVLNGDVSFMSVQVTNSGAGDVNGFKIQVQLFRDGPWFDYLGNTDFASTTEGTMVKASSVGPHAVTSGNSAFAIVRMDGIYAMRLMAKGTAAATLSVSWFAKRVRVFG